MSRDTPTSSPGRDPASRALDWLQARGEAPAVNPRRGKLPGVVVTADRTAIAVAWGVGTLLVLVAATIVTMVFGDQIGGFIYANF